MTRLHLLGGFALRHRGELLDLQPAAQRLLAFLALVDATVERSFTAFRLWPDIDEDRARASLRSTMWRLRRDHRELLWASRTHLRLGDDIWVDVTHGLGAEDLGEADRATVSLHDDLLPDWYDEWLVVERERVRQARLHALEARARSALDAGRIGDAIQFGLRAVAIEPLRESAHRLVVEAHIVEGNVADALRQFGHCARIMERELGAAPSGVMVGLLPRECRPDALV